MQVVDLNIHTFALYPKQFKITSIFMIFCLITNSTEEKIVCKDFFNEGSDNCTQPWNACDDDDHCQKTFTEENYGSYKAISIGQSQFEFLLYKTLELEPHYELKLELKFLRVNNDNQREFIIYIDGKIEHQQIYSNQNSSDTNSNCQKDQNYLIFPISITTQHSSTSVTVAMLAQNKYWGITQFQLSIKECSKGCNSCNSFGCFNQELFLQLFYQKYFSITSEEEWQSGENTAKDCLGFNYIKSSGSDLFKVFELDLHNAISFQLKLLIFNSESTKIHIYIDEQQVLEIDYVYQQIKIDDDICDYISMKEINVFQYQHKRQWIKIHINVDQIQKHNNNHIDIGMRDFQLFLSNDGSNDECMDKNLVPFDGCFSNNYDCVQGCGNCIKGICYDCLEGWQYLEQIKSCIPDCGDSKITYDEECDDGNQQAYDGCHQCKYSCPINCRVCGYGKCLEVENQHLLLEVEYKYIPDNINNIYLDENRFCFDLDINQRSQYITPLENQFDIIFNIISLCYFDFNLISFKVYEYQYHQLKFEQINNCKVEQFGKCLECQDEYELDFHKKYCIPKCQDGIILSQEVCDDQNTIQFDGCYKCQQSCQIECLLCSDNKCYMCKEGWQLQEYQCKQICGDGLLAILSNEQCDDPKDPNCVDCKYQCDPNCLVCDQQQNCEQCLFPFEIKDGKCIPICGDNIITPLFEQCDDGNDIPFDGCFECEYQCSYGCITCEKDNHCLQCQDQYYILDTSTFECYELKQILNSEPKKDELNNNDLFIIQCNENQAFINNQCINLCGNGILNSNYEQCDDGNTDGGDGCSALCFEEDSFKCINQENSLSFCTFIQAPNFNLILLSDKINQNKILDLSFSQEVYISSENLFENVVEIMIIPQTKYQLTIVPLINITAQLSKPNYNIYIQLLEPVVEPILQINIQKFSIFNEVHLDLSIDSKQISLGTPFVLSTTTKERVNSVIKMNEAMLYSIVGLAGILLLTGNFIVFFNLLDLLQSLSYIRYMQYRFPPHLREFLETYTKISLQPILDSLKIDEMFAKLNGGTLPFIGKKSQQSKQVDMINQFYLINAKGCYLSYVVSLLTYFICCLITSIKVSQWLGRYFEKNKESMKVLRLISTFQKRIQSKCSTVKNYYFSLGIYQLFYSTLHQLLFSTLLQFPDYTFNSIFEIINSIFALASLQFLIQIFFRLFSITTQKIQDKYKWRYFYQDTKTGFWACNFKPLQIYRTVFYITIIVKFRRYPEAQSILLSMQSLFYSLYLISFRPIKSNFDLAKLLSREVLFLIITGSFLVYSLELNEDQFLLYGWLHISLFCFLIGFTLIIDILDQGKQAYYYRLKNIEKKEKRQIQLYFDNPLQRFIWNDNLNLKKKK